MTDWIDVPNPPSGVDVLQVRARSESGRWTLTGLRIQGEGLTADTLRGISIPRIAARLNSEGGPPRERLHRPSGDDPDRFYGLVAAAYRHYATQSRAAAKSIAEEAGVPVTTAHRWVREARRRGHLPAGHRGRTG